MSYPAAAGLGLLAALALPPLRAGLEGIMWTHMLVQIPLLIVAGALLGSALPARWRAALAPWDRAGVAGLLLALFALAWWMLPRHLDAALESAAVDAAKFASLALLVGLPLRLSWPRVPFVLRGVVASKLVAMLAVMGWLYLVAPLRVCNNYLVSDQETLGRLLLLAALGLGLALALRAFTLDGRTSQAHQHAVTQPQGAAHAD
ncbi:hypothetical protein HUS23_01775 [Ectothiorhodospiraceae bacterium 2226]|nr:hypothetical protein HUS23_01775 [Ectothiorhodospiraceae bacterium 2226]